MAGPWPGCHRPVGRAWHPGQRGSGQQREDRKPEEIGRIENEAGEDQPDGKATTDSEYHKTAAATDVLEVKGRPNPHNSGTTCFVLHPTFHLLWLLSMIRGPAITLFIIELPFVQSK
jgi:hypothetical protein